MKKFAFLFVFLNLICTGCCFASTEENDGTGNYISDAEMQTAVRNFSACLDHAHSVGGDGNKLCGSYAPRDLLREYVKVIVASDFHPNFQTVVGHEKYDCTFRYDAHDSVLMVQIGREKNILTVLSIGEVVH